jgi:hypothetical protein
VPGRFALLKTINLHLLFWLSLIPFVTGWMGANSYQGQMTLDEIVGGSLYGATTIAGGQGQRQPSAIKLQLLVWPL